MSKQGNAQSPNIHRSPLDEKETGARDDTTSSEVSAKGTPNLLPAFQRTLCADVVYSHLPGAELG